MRRLILILLLWPIAGWAQERGEPAYVMEELIVTATRAPWPLARLPKSVTVFTAEEIAARGLRTVHDLLREVPSLNVVQAGSWGSQTSVFLRGGNSNHLLVLLDGVPVNSPTTAAFNWTHLSLDNVERVEVVSGPQSTLYGSEALAGVVNIITRTGRESPSTVRGMVRTGKDEWFEEHLGLTTSVEGAAVSLGLSRLDVEGPFPHDRYGTTTLSAKADFLATGTQRLTLFTRLHTADKDLPAVPGRFGDPNQEQSDDFRQVGVAWELELAPWWRYRLRLAVADEEFEFNNPPDEVSDFSLFSTIDTRILNGEIQQTFTPHRDLYVVVGGEWEELEGVAFSNFGRTFDEDLVNRALFGQIQAVFLDRFSGVAGLRWDDHSEFGSDLNGEVGLAIQLPLDAKVRGTVSSGFRAPSINELFFPGFGNPDLEAEESDGWEVGLSKTFLDGRVFLEGAYYQNDFEDLIVAVQDAETGLFRPENVREAETEGIEVRVRIQPIEAFTIEAQISDGEAVDRTTDQQLLRRPETQGSLAIQYTHPRWGTLHLRGLFVGERPDFGEVSLRDYQRVDLALALPLLKATPGRPSLGLNLRFENLLNERYEEAGGFPAPRFQYVVGLSSGL